MHDPFTFATMMFPVYPAPPNTLQVRCCGIRDLIKVQASDDFEVAAVHIAVLDNENNVLFQGPAVLTNALWQLGPLPLQWRRSRSR